MCRNVFQLWEVHFLELLLLPLQNRKIVADSIVPILVIQFLVENMLYERPELSERFEVPDKTEMVA